MHAFYKFNYLPSFNFFPVKLTAEKTFGLYLLCTAFRLSLLAYFGDIRQWDKESPDERNGKSRNVIYSYPIDIFRFFVFQVSYHLLHSFGFWNWF